MTLFELLASYTDAWVTYREGIRVIQSPTGEDISRMLAVSCGISGIRIGLRS